MTGRRNGDVFRSCICGAVQVWTPRGDRLVWVCRSCGREDQDWGDQARAVILLSSDRIQRGTLPREAGQLIRQAFHFLKMGHRLMARYTAGAHPVSQKIWEVAEDVSNLKQGSQRGREGAPEGHGKRGPFPAPLPQVVES